MSNELSSLKSFLPQIFWSRLCLKLNSTFLASSLTKENYFFKNLESKWVPRLGQLSLIKRRRSLHITHITPSSSSDGLGFKLAEFVTVRLSHLSFWPFNLDVTPIDDEKFLVCHMIFHFWKFQWSIRHLSHYPLDISSLLIFPSDDDGKIRFGNFAWKNQRTQSRSSCLPSPSSDTIFHDSTFSWFYRNFSILLWRWFRR